MNYAPGLVSWSLRDTAVSIRAGEMLEKGIDGNPENDMLFHELVLEVTGDAEAARKALKKRVSNRVMDQARATTNK